MRSLAMIPALALVLSVEVVAPPPARAWGELGHLTVCDLAYRNFTPTTREALKVLFNAPHGITVNEDGRPRHYTSFNVGCLEEDERPRAHPSDHFINVPRNTVALTGPNCPVSPSSGQPVKCILSGIERDRAILKDTARSRQDRVISLMAIGHWVGDIHQPLHISFKDDTGGNGIGVRFRGKCGIGSSGNPYRPGSFHAVWDNCLLENGIFQRVRERSDYRPSWSRRTITYRAVDTLNANTSATERKQWTQSEPWQWAAESYAITKQSSVQYCVMVGASCQYSSTVPFLAEGVAEKKVEIDAAYLNQFKDVAGERVRKAGIRLAHIVNSTLDPAYSGF